MTPRGVVRHAMAAVLAVGTGIAAPEVGWGQVLPLRPPAPAGNLIAPFMEGWYDNGDGTYTISFGYVNQNNDVIEIPIGENNFIEPEQFNGMQPTVFQTGHPRGVFTVTLPADMAGTDVWWTIRTPEGQEARVPGRHSAPAYELDKNPRPHGTVAPLIWFGEGEGGKTGQYPAGVVSERVERVRVGELLTLTVHAKDVSERDPEDSRLEGEVIFPVTLTWFKHQGPQGPVEFVRHPSTPVPERPNDGDTESPTDDEANVIELAEGSGTALVQARFHAPGEYTLRVQADQFGSAPDSSSQDQCCWTNGYVRVVVTP